MRRLALLPLLLLPFLLTGNPAPAGHAAPATVHKLDLLPSGIYKAPASLPRSTRLPASVDLTRWAESVRDQGQVGSCGSYATTQLEYWQYNHDYGLTYPDGFAPMEQYSRAAQANGGDVGSTFPQNYDVEQKYGAVPVHQYEAKPHDSDGAHAARWDWHDLPSASDDAHAAPHRITGYHLLFSTYPNGGGQAGLDAIKAELAAGHPVAIGFTVTNEYMFYGSTNGQPIQPGGATVFGRHANVVYGFHSDSTLTDQNQWNLVWGHAGWAQLSPGFVKQMVEEAWVIDGVTNPNPSPTAAPTRTPAPTATAQPTRTPKPTANPTSTTEPTALPTATLAPPPLPTVQPTKPAGHCERWGDPTETVMVIDGRKRHVRIQFCKHWMSH